MDILHYQYIYIYIYMVYLGSNNLTQPTKMTNEMVDSAWPSVGYFAHQVDPDRKRIARRLGGLPSKVLKNE